MARFNEILVGRYNRLLQKLLSMKGPASLVTLSDEAMAVFPLFSGVENRYLEGWDRFRITWNPSAIVGQTLSTQLRNPTGSGVIAVLEQISASAGALVGVDISQQGGNPADLAVIGAGFRLDPRTKRVATSLVISSGAGAILANNQYRISVPTGVPDVQVIITENQEWTLLPGDAIRFTAEATNVAIGIDCCWRERILEDSELF